MLNFSTIIQNDYFSAKHDDFIPRKTGLQVYNQVAYRPSTSVMIYLAQEMDVSVHTV